MYPLLPWIMLWIKLSQFFVSASVWLQVPRLFLHPSHCFFYQWPAVVEWAKRENVSRDFMLWENWKCFSHFGAVVAFSIFWRKKNEATTTSPPLHCSRGNIFVLTTRRHSPETGLWEMFIQPLLAFVIFSRYRHYQRNTRALFIHCCVAIPFYFVHWLFVSEPEKQHKLHACDKK